jgi:purine catabolism regulator
MSQLATSVQPTIKQLLATDALSEAQVLCGELERPISQVISTLGESPRPGSLVVTQSESVFNTEVAVLAKLSALVIVRSTPATPESIAVGAAKGEGEAALGAFNDAALKRLVKRCKDADIPLLVVPSYGDPVQVLEDVRYVFLRELKLSSARLYSVMLSIALEEGLDGLIEVVSGWLNRPLSVETADFKVLAARNMGATPASQQRHLSDESMKCLRIYKKNLEALSPKVGPLLDGQADLHIAPVRLGRRLVFPVPFSELIAGYVSVMVRPQDDLNQIAEYMQPLALACKVDFSHRLKDSPSFAATQRTLLKDLISGRGLASADQERLERSFGFDLCDGFQVFAVDVQISKEKGKSEAPIVVQFPDDKFISCDLEGMRAFVVPHFAKNAETWRKHAEDIIAAIRDLNKGDGNRVAVRLGAGRLVETMPEIADAYGEARQALVIGSMMHGEGEFLLEYGELGVRRLLYLIFDHPEVERFLEETLSPLASYDEEWESELVDTLKVYLEQGANLNSTARALFIHRHTLRYRLEQIADILKVDIDSQEVLLNLQIAFLIKDMKEGGKKKQ